MGMSLISMSFHGHFVQSISEVCIVRSLKIIEKKSHYCIEDVFCVVLVMLIKAVVTVGFVGNNWMIMLLD